MKRLIYISVFILSCFGYMQNIQAQKDGFIYESKIVPGTEVFIMTNQEVIQTDSATFSMGNLIEQDEPKLYKAVFLGEDSIEYKPMDSEVFFQNMGGKEGNWLMFVHGAGKTFQRATWRAFDIAHYHQMNVLVYSWPSADPQDMSLKGFKNVLRKYPASLPHLKTSLEMVEAFKKESFKQDQKLSLVLHSMGNLLLQDLQEKQQLNALSEDLFDNLIINAASVKQEDHKDWVEDLNIQKNIYITLNKGDVNLLGVRAFMGQGIQLGQKIKSEPAQNASYINFTKAIGFKLPPGLSHTYFIAESAEKNPEITHFYQQLFQGEKVEIKKSSTFSERKDGVGYDFVLNKKAKN